MQQGGERVGSYHKDQISLRQHGSFQQHDKGMQQNGNSDPGRVLGHYCHNARILCEKSAETRQYPTRKQVVGQSNEGGYAKESLNELSAGLLVDLWVKALGSLAERVSEAGKEEEHPHHDVVASQRDDAVTGRTDGHYIVANNFGHHDKKDGARQFEQIDEGGLVGDRPKRNITISACRVVVFSFDA